MREEAQLEFLGGRIGRKVWPDGPRGRAIQWFTRACLAQRPELWLDSRQGLSVGRHREGRARPDGSLVPSHAFAGAGEWADPAPVLMVKVHSRPDGGRYETVQTLPFGKEVALPEPVGISLDTEPLKNWVR
ncbi:hypothetical protein [Streptomyces coelicoflavus]|uniref:hypothetical protein n=1 Tax=Streptomyces coelicoflavus TaxID=285562 RepID=UPI00367E8DF0